SQCRHQWYRGGKDAYRCCVSFVLRLHVTPRSYPRGITATDHPAKLNVLIPVPNVKLDPTTPLTAVFRGSNMVRSRYTASSTSPRIPTPRSHDRDSPRAWWREQ